MENCSKCGKEICFTGGVYPCLCTECRRKEGLPPYDFVDVDIVPFVKGQKSLLKGVDAQGNGVIEEYIAENTGFSLSWIARGYGFSTTDFWIDGDGNWYREDEPYPDDFLEEAIKFFLSKVKISEGLMTRQEMIDALINDTYNWGLDSLLYWAQDELRDKYSRCSDEVIKQKYERLLSERKSNEN